MASTVDIWNAALIELGQKSVIDEAENTASAVLVRARYPQVLDALLTKNAWTWATRRVKIPRLVDVPVNGWRYYYKLPSQDYLTLLGVWDDDKFRRHGEIDYQIEEEDRLAADAEEVWIKYIADVDDPNQMHPLFREAVSAELASRIANRINELSGRRQDMMEWARKTLADARSADSQANASDMIPDDTWIWSRQGTIWRQGRW